MHKWSGRTETATENRVGQVGSQCHCGSHLSVASSIAAMQISDACSAHLLSCNISDILLSTGLKSREPGGHSCSGINSEVSFGNNSMVAHAQWAFQVSQGSVEPLFWLSGKRLHHDFAAKLFYRQWTNFYQHRLSFVGAITKTFWSLFHRHSVDLYSSARMGFTVEDSFCQHGRSCTLPRRKSTDSRRHIARVTTLSVTWNFSRMSNRSAGLISRRHSDENSLEFEVFKMVNFNLNEEARGDRPHLTPNAVSSSHQSK